MKIITRLAAIGAAFTSFAPAAHAGDGFRVAVQSEDLNLASARGQAALADRIDAAADKVCGYIGVVSLREFAASAACRQAFEKDALAQANRMPAMNGRGASFAAAGR